MTAILIILGILVLIVLGALVPEPKYRCDMCKDSGYIDDNIWYDEVVTVECPKCKEEGERARKIKKLMKKMKKYEKRRIN